MLCVVAASPFAGSAIATLRRASPPDVVENKQRHSAFSGADEIAPPAEQRIGQNVTIVGKVKAGGDGNFIHLEGPDGGDIVVNREGAQGPYGSDFVEVVGMVGSDKTVTVRCPIRALRHGGRHDLLPKSCALLACVIFARLQIAPSFLIEPTSHAVQSPTPS